MVYVDRSWWPKGLNRWGLDPRKPMAPQVAANVLGVGFILLGPALTVVMIDHWAPLVTDQAIYVAGLGGMALFFLLSFPAIPGRILPPKLPLSMRIMFRLGVALAATGWVIGVVGILNGYGTPTAVREVPVVAKHQSLERDPARRSNYITTRAWPGSAQVQDLDAPIGLYDALPVPESSVHTPKAVLQAMPNAARVRLVVGKGRLGLDWLKAVEPAA